MSSMAKPQRYLTKSRFKVAYECPAKLFYHDRPNVYGNKNQDNEFLRALAHGGFQVGALAKLYYPEGIDLEGLGTQEAIAKTRELLAERTITLFEAAIQTGPFLIRVDILKKVGDQISLIEVKSKSFDPDQTTDFFKNDKSGLNSKWEPYLIDVGFQTWVSQQAYPSWKISPFLMLANKQARASMDGIHQNFRLITQDKRNTRVETRPGVSAADLGEKLLVEVSVDREVDYILQNETFPNEERLPGFANYLAEHHQNQTRALCRINSLCKSCEFRTKPSVTHKSGFDECWASHGKIHPTDQGRDLIFDLWNCHRTEHLLAHDKLFFDQLTEEDLKPKTKSKRERALAPYQRQWIQVEKKLNQDLTPYVDLDGLRELFAELTYPLHCIDFETTTVAIPFHAGLRPYEQIAFQFSHHLLHEDGRVEHFDQYLDMRPGEFPNFDFVRRLRDSLSHDQGSIFRYATHENTVLRQIKDQLLDNPQPDQEELLRFIDSITKPRASEGGGSPGTRAMLDLKEIVLEHYYHPLMGGSNSIKKVIPAVLEDSDFLKSKYSSAIYGRNQEIKSLNFDDWTWIERDGTGRVRDPYKRLPPVFMDLPQDWFNEQTPFFADDSIDDGGAAMTAWSRMQFTEMSNTERAAIEAALLKYCELDTLSMVWLLEYWRDVLSRVS